MLNIIQHLKCCVFLSVTWAFMVGYVLAESLDIPTGHWQDNMAVGETIFGGTLYASYVPWQWQPQAVQMKTRDIRTELAGNGSILMVTRPGQEFYILKGHMTLVACSSLELQPSVSLLQSEQGGADVRGELEHGQVRYGEITFKVNHVLAWQDSFSATKGWARVSGVVTPGIEKQIGDQLWQVENYEWSPLFSGQSVNPNVFISDEYIASSVNDKSKVKVVGGWITTLSDIQVNFPGVEEPVKHWQGHLTAEVKYF